MKSRTRAARRHAAKTLSVMTVLATILGGSASLGTTLASAKAKPKHHKVAKCKAGHKDADQDKKDGHCPDDHDGAAV